MAEKTDLLLASDDYLEHFDSRGYLNSRYGGDCKDWTGFRAVQPFYLQCYYEFYQEFHESWDPTTARLLEVGGGPIIYSLISAAPHVKEIVFGEFLETNRREVALWKEGNPAAFNWTPYFRHVVNVIEKSPGEEEQQSPGEEEEEVRKREEVVRSRLSSITHCDIKQRPALRDHSEPFHIVCTNLCLESVNETYEEFAESIRLLHTLVRPGGYLTMMVSVERHVYTVSGHLFYQLYLTTADITRALESASFAVVVSKRLDMPEAAGNAFDDCKGFEFFVGHRKSED